MVLADQYRPKAPCIASDERSDRGSPSWVEYLADGDSWHSLAPNSEIKCCFSEKPIVLPHGGLYPRTFLELEIGRKLVIFTSDPPQPWYRSALKVGAGVALGVATVAAAPAVVGAGIGVTAAGPVAGGLVATKMAAGGGIAAGGALATAQSVAMGGAGTAAIAGGGMVGGILSRIGLRVNKDSHCLSLPKSEAFFCGRSGKVYLAVDVPEGDSVIVLSAGAKQASKL
eukprot:TRINITY_DN49065_c0_g1_i1.p1 TRINITY_DN49065_c0_g1~~TRINITY_DN49065_c0_g1_i1.p1  ORF type:complete len:265 (+),score=25.70 TRINITY_DN49065_c0_g1_i1:116-796(+)